MNCRYGGEGRGGSGRVWTRLQMGMDEKLTNGNGAPVDKGYAGMLGGDTILKQVSALRWKKLSVSREFFLKFHVDRLG